MGQGRLRSGVGCDVMGRDGGNSLSIFSVFRVVLLFRASAMATPLLSVSSFPTHRMCNNFYQLS